MKANAAWSGGAQVSQGGVQFRVWAPRARGVQVVFADEEHRPLTLQSEPGGYFSAYWQAGKAGSLYRFQLDDGDVYPDPYSRYQPEGPKGPSMVVDPHAYRWRDTEWKGLDLQGLVLYEMHIGTFTAAGTFDAAIDMLPRLVDLGVNCLELMPVVEFAGHFNWGYDGVNLFAPYHGYGDAQAFKRFVDACHALKLGVILDVVYNHAGPGGDYLAAFSPDYFTERYKNEWGPTPNFDGPGCDAVRAYYLENAVYWIEEFHLDGLRLDATQNIMDSSTPHFINELVARTRAAAAPRRILIVGENEPQEVSLIDPVEKGGAGLDGLWNDDFHHSARVALTSQHDGYFNDYRGRAHELLAAVRHNFLFQGQRSLWQRKARGTPALRHDPRAFITFTQNHDQVGNTFYGKRIHELTSPARLRAITALHLLAPQTPLLFMGQELDSPPPFCFFADHPGELATQVWEGRKSFLRQFSQYAQPDAQDAILNPADPKTFELSKLPAADSSSTSHMFRLHRDLLQLRRHDPVISRQRREDLEGATLTDHALILRWVDDTLGDRLLLVNLGAQLELRPLPEPLLAPPAQKKWKLAWSSESPRYGGSGSLCPFTDEGDWTVWAESATLVIASA
jgi:maltooligosyltrehalose trehalohydrolase